MSLLRRGACAAVLPLAVLAAGCSSSGGHSAPPSSTAAPTGSPKAGSAQAVALGSTMRTGMAGLSSAHIVVDAGSLGGTSVGDVTFAGGEATASDLTLSLGGTTRVVTVGATTYAKLPPGRSSSPKPWLVVTSTSTNQFVRALNGQVSIIKAASSLPAIADVVASATSVQDLGPSAAGHHYALKLDTSAISGTALGSQLADLGTNPLPVDVYLDPKGRPLKIQISAKLGTQTLPIIITVTKFDAPVTITAPPAAQVQS